MARQSHKIILDTDMGTDIDDAFALGFILASKKFNLQAITTVYENVAARAKQARTMLKIAGKEQIPVAAGCGAIMSPPEKLYLNPFDSYLDKRIPYQYDCCLEEAELPPLDIRHGVDLLIEMVMNSDDDIIIVSIGPMTNIAMAIVKEPLIIAKIPKIMSMSSTFDYNKPEFNILCDPVAANIVFSSGIPIDIVSTDVTLQVEMNQKHIDRLNGFSSPLAQNIQKALHLWQTLSATKTKLPILHDPLVLEVMVDPTLLEWKYGTAKVCLSDDSNWGVTKFQENDQGKHRYACKVNSEQAIDMWLNSIQSLNIVKSESEIFV
jgi:inosine-uridine nucleoside N-ribohydrolase